VWGGVLANGGGGHRQSAAHGRYTVREKEEKAEATIRRKKSGCGCNKGVRIALSFCALHICRFGISNAVAVQPSPGQLNVAPSCCIERGCSV
jgi:hypothetical protein